ncbi:MAG: enoyl-CoA hydratase/isomerase family protein [Methylocystaceae bacterium]|nr:enoyl-CoA hydratase/isomerase family protein [Methylocystaceae bacterium]
MSETLIFDNQGPVWKITLNRPEKKNALDAELKAAILSALDECEKNVPDVLIITGAGKAFCAGQDLNERKGHTEVNLEASINEFYAPLAERIRELECVTIAAVPGIASGAGANLALLCDIVIAAKSANFIQPFTHLGLIPDVGGSWVLPRLIGDARARGFILLGKPISAVKAEDWGMIWAAVEDDRLDEEIDEISQLLSKRSKEAHKAVSSLMNKHWDETFDAHLGVEAWFQGQLGRSCFYRNAVRNFFEKRT